MGGVSGILEIATVHFAGRLRMRRFQGQAGVALDMGRTIRPNIGH